MDNTTVRVVRVDYSNPTHAADLVYLLNAYAMDPMGGGAPLLESVKSELTTALARRPFALSLIGYFNGKPAGLINAFEGFSTFAAKPLLNIHDVVVLPDFRGYGISQRLLAELEVIARERGCCKLTLEVLQGNSAAQAAYRKFGFAGYELDPQMGQAVFWQKKLS